MSRIHISHTLRELYALRSQLDNQTADEQSATPATKEDIATIARLLEQLASFVDYECQNSHVPRPRFGPHG